MRIYHDGTNNVIESSVGDLLLLQHNNDKDIVFYNDDGSGGTTPYLTVDGSATRTNVHKNLRFDDNIAAVFGAGAELKLHSDGTNGIIDNHSGSLLIRQHVDGGDIAFQSDDGSGGTTSYITLDGSRADGTYVYTTMPDYGVMAFGASVDMQLYHDGTDSTIRNNTGDLNIVNFADDKDIIFKSDDGSGGVAIYMMLDGSEGRISTKVNNRFDDGARLELGTSADLRIYHDGSNSYIKEVGTGTLRLQTNGGGIDLYKDSTEFLARFITDGAVELYYDSVKKFETTSTGVEVTGDIALTGSVQKQISTTHHTFTTVSGGSAAQDYWVPFIGANELASPNVTHRTIAPYGGILKKAIVHSTAAFGSSVQVRFHRIDNGTTSVFVNDNSTDDVTTNVTADMSTAYSSVAFDFTTGNTFSTGDQIGVSFVRNNTAQGDVAMTLVWEYELF